MPASSRFAPHVALLTLALVLTPVAAAETLTFSFSGTVTSVASVLTAVSNPGDTFHGAYVYDSSTPASVGFANVATYGNAISSAIVNVGSFWASEAVGDVQVQNAPADRLAFTTVSSSGAAIGSYSLYGWNLILDDPSGTVFSDVSLPAGPFSLSSFDNVQLSIQFRDGRNRAFVVGQVNSISGPSAQATSNVTPVPEPSTFALIASGMVGVYLRRSYENEV